MKKIICILGRTCSGKDTFVKRMGLNPIVSYTTRPMRVNEVNGREHWFISDKEADELLSKGDILAYTEIGEYRYFATLDKLENNMCYIIDVKGLEYLKDKFKDKLDIVVIYVNCDKEIRKERAKNRDYNDYVNEFDKRERNEDMMFREFEREGKGGWDYEVTVCGC